MKVALFSHVCIRVFVTVCVCCKLHFRRLWSSLNCTWNTGLPCSGMLSDSTRLIWFNLLTKILHVNFFLCSDSLCTACCHLHWCRVHLVSVTGEILGESLELGKDWQCCTVTKLKFPQIQPELPQLKNNKTYHLSVLQRSDFFQILSSKSLWHNFCCWWCVYCDETNYQIRCHGILASTMIPCDILASIMVIRRRNKCHKGF